MLSRRMPGSPALKTRVRPDCPSRQKHRHRFLRRCPRRREPRLASPPSRLPTGGSHRMCPASLLRRLRRLRKRRDKTRITIRSAIPRVGPRASRCRASRRQGPRRRRAWTIPTPRPTSRCHSGHLLQTGRRSLRLRARGRASRKTPAGRPRNGPWTSTGRLQNRDSSRTT